jgi:restriction system protein
MGRTWVKGHYRNRRRSKKRSSSSENGCIFRIAGISILALFALYLLSRIPSQVFFVFFLLVLLAVISFAALKIYQVQHRKRQEQENQASQQYMLQIQVQQQMVQQQQAMEHQQAMIHYQMQIQQQREREQLTRIKSLGDMLTLSNSEFEKFVGKLLSANAYYDVEQVGKSGDHGADLIAHDVQGNRVIVQCKKYSTGNNVGEPDIQKFAGSIMHYKAQRGIFVTTSLFTQNAKEFAKDKPILLVDGDLLVQWVQNTHL